MVTFDLETLSNSTTAPIVQIAAVKFNSETAEVISEFVRNIKLGCLGRYEFDVSYETLGWWFSQDDEAIKSVFCKEGVEDLRKSLLDFVFWLGKPSDYLYWSHSTFDPPILNYNFLKVGLKNPINYKLFLDIRTLISFTGKPNLERFGIKHDALEDCRYQSQYISQALSVLREKGVGIVC